MKNRKIILIASEGTNVGKSHLARLIKKSHNDCNILSFASPLKDSCDLEFKTLYPFVNNLFSYYYSDRKYKDQPLSNIDKDINGKLSKFTLREFLIKVSDLYKSRYGSDFFINKSVIESSALQSSLIVFDDLITDRNANKLASEYYIKGRKVGFSMVYISQSYYQIAKLIRDNCQYFILGRNLLKKDLRMILSVFPTEYTLDEFTDLYNELTNEPLDTVLINIDKKYISKNIIGEKIRL